MNGLQNTSTDTMFAPLTNSTPKNERASHTGTPPTRDSQDEHIFTSMFAQLDENLRLESSETPIHITPTKDAAQTNATPILSEKAIIDMNVEIGSAVALDMNRSETINIPQKGIQSAPIESLMSTGISVPIEAPVLEKISVSGNTPLPTKTNDQALLTTSTMGLDNPTPNHSQIRIDLSETTPSPLASKTALASEDPSPLRPKAQTAVPVEKSMPTSQIQTLAVETTPTSKAKTLASAVETASASKAQTLTPTVETAPTLKPQALTSVAETTPISKAQTLTSAVETAPTLKPQALTSVAETTPISKAQILTSAAETTPASKVQTPVIGNLSISEAQIFMPFVEVPSAPAPQLAITATVSENTIPDQVQTNTALNISTTELRSHTPHTNALVEPMDSTSLLTTTAMLTTESASSTIEMRNLDITPTLTASSLANKVSSIPQAPIMSHIAVQQVSDAIVKNVNKGGDIVIRLDPAELGKVNITFSFDKNNGVTANVVAETSATAAVLRERADVLATQLKQSGFDDVNLNFDSQDDNRSETNSGTYFSDQNAQQNQRTPTIFDIQNVENEGQITVQPSTPTRRFGVTDTIDIKL